MSAAARSAAVQLAETVRAKLGGLALIAGNGWADDQEIADRCQQVVAFLGSDDRQTKVRVVGWVLRNCDTEVRGWWASPLGVLVARAQMGDVDVSVTHAEAAGMLGVQRGGIGGMVTKGMLERHPDGGVSRRSVLARIGRHG